MAVFFNSAATGANDGTSWADAYTSLLTSLSGVADGSTIAIANTHDESPTDATANLIFPTESIVICSTVSGTNTITPTIATSEQYYIGAGGADVDINIIGNGSKIYGCWFTSMRTLSMYSVDSEACTWGAGYVTSTGSILFNFTTNRMINSLNDTFKAYGQPNTAFVISDSTKAVLRNPTFTAATWDASVYALRVQNRSYLEVYGGDLSAISATNLLQLDGAGVARINGVKLNAATTNLINTAVEVAGKFISIDATDSSNDIQRRYYATFYGELVNDIGIYLNAATPAAVGFSNKAVSNTNAAPWILPLRVQLSTLWADVSTAKTFTVELCQDGTTTALNDDEFWIEVDYPKSTSVDKHTQSTRGTYGSGSALTTSSAAWTGLSGTNVKQKVSLTTANASQAGLVDIYICLAKPSTTVYIDPKITVT